MGLGIGRFLRYYLIRYRVIQAKFIATAWGFNRVTQFLQQVDKGSVLAILKNFGATIGKDCDIETGIVLCNASTGFQNLTIEDGCHVGQGTLLDLMSSITIHEYSTLSMRTTIITHLDIGKTRISHPKYQPYSAPVEIGPDVYIGANSTLLAGVKVGSGSIVGAGALVKDEIPSGVVAAGVPARIIRKL